MLFYCIFYKKRYEEFEDKLDRKSKVKPLSKSQILISLDRLTRFKPTEEKYLRVFKDIVVSNLIYPKYKKTQLDAMDYELLVKIIEEIFNFSFVSLDISPSHDFSINKKLLKYEKSVFKYDKNVEKLLENKIDYKAAMEMLANEKLPLNLKWLQSLAQEDNQIDNRVNLGLKFPLEKIVIVEGITEEILLPKFALMCGYDFDKMGIIVISAGGKNQVVKLFYRFADILKLPIFVLLDNDAKDNFEEISSKLRIHDKVHILECGEFEDTLSLNLIKRTLNKYFDFSSVLLGELKQDVPMTQVLQEIFKQRGLEFKKAEFAALVGENILAQKDISPEIKNIFFHWA
mgnify:CR=1 FL=1